MNEKIYRFRAVLKKVPDIDGAYIEFPGDARQEFGKGRVKVSARFDGIPYEGSLVRMGTPGHILGVRKSIRARLGKEPGDEVEVELGSGNSLLPPRQGACRGGKGCSGPMDLPHIRAEKVRLLSAVLDGGSVLFS